LVTGNSQQKIYVGGALDLKERFSTQFAAECLAEWVKRDAQSISFLPKPEATDPIDLLSMQKRLIQLEKERPRLNDLGPAAA
jgi:hypothetical protein